MTRRTWTLAGVTVTAALALSACGSSTPSGSPTTTASSGQTTATLATTTSTAATATTGPTTTTTIAPAAAKPCSTLDLRVKSLETDGTAGTVYVEVIVGTKNGVTCSVDGYPDADLYGKEQGVEATLPEMPKHEAVAGTAPMGAAATRIVIGPSSTSLTAFFLGVVQVQSGSKSCESADGLEYRAPGSNIWSGEVPFKTSMTACEPTFYVSVFQPPISEG